MHRENKKIYGTVYCDIQTQISHRKGSSKRQTNKKLTLITKLSSLWPIAPKYIAKSKTVNVWKLRQTCQISFSKTI